MSGKIQEKHISPGKWLVGNVALVTVRLINIYINIVLLTVNKCAFLVLRNIIEYITLNLSS